MSSVPFSPNCVRVQLSERSYDIEVACGNLSRLGEFVAAREKVTHAVIVSDHHVAGTHGEIALASLQSAGYKSELLTVDAGETAKAASVAERLWNDLAKLRADRKTIVVAVGGGVIGDLAGFVAATYTRGLRFFQVPTTLLAQVDSSVGGKVGINLPSAKNLVGAFWQPRGVLIDIATLQTLPEREFLSGLAEVVKYGVILDASFFDYLEQNAGLILQRDPQVLTHIIARSCQLKATVVEQDEREETGLRAVLNYGHTFAHAFETVASYGTLLHGEAVSIGMMCAARLAHRLGRVNSDFVKRQEKLLQSLQLPLRSPALSHAALLEAMQQDKKVEHGKLRFVLPLRIGEVALVSEISPEKVLASL